MSKFCRNCGEELNENQDVCLKCGVSVQEHNSSNLPTEDKAEKSAATGFILGLCSLIAWIIPLFGYPVTICGIVFSSKGLKSNTNKGKATAGLVLSIVFLIITLINSIAGVIINLSNL
jgi:uncharacterized membrane protein YvbJ